MPFDGELPRFGLDHPLAPKAREGSATGASIARAPTSVPATDQGYYVVAASKAPRPQTRLKPMVEWEGIVETVDWDAEEFTARLREIGSDDHSVEYGTFSLEEVDQDDLDLLRSGGIFRWVIGKRENAYRRVENTSKLIFRRLPGYSVSDLIAAEAQADAWGASIKVR